MSTERYDGQRWRRLSRRIRAQRPACETPGCDNPSAEVHHIDGQGLHGPRAYDPTNLQALCKSCHSTHTGASRPSRQRPRTSHPGLIDPHEAA